MSTPQEAVEARRKLRQSIKRCHKLAARCIAQVCDGDLPDVDRESAQSRALKVIGTRKDLERSLRRVNNALEGWTHERDPER